jgi:hypothetical protein
LDAVDLSQVDHLAACKLEDQVERLGSLPI